MGRGGHNRLSDAEKKRRGTFRPSRGERARSEPPAPKQRAGKLPPGPAKPPWTLAAAALAVWNEIVPAGHFTEADVPALAALCEVAVRIVGNPTPASADMAAYRDLATQLGLSEEVL